MSTATAVTFDIISDDIVCGKEPPRILLMKNKQNEKRQLTADEIEMKQKQAQERRELRFEARLKRMQEREEVTRKLTSNVEVLLQQQSLRKEPFQHPDHDVPLMTSCEVLKTVYDVVKGFDEIRQKLVDMDLKVDEKKYKPLLLPDTKWQRALKVSKPPKYHQREKVKTAKLAQKMSKEPMSVKEGTRVIKEGPTVIKEGIAFEIPCDDLRRAKTCTERPVIARLAKKNLAKNKETIALKMEEKQRKAAERRQKRQDYRVRQTRESRESVMALQAKVEAYQQHQAKLDGMGESHMKLSKQEAASLAHDIAEGFSAIHSKYERDLKRAMGFFMIYAPAPNY